MSDLDHTKILDNPGLLKLELMRRGLRVDPAAHASISRDDPCGPDDGVEVVTGHALFGSSDDVDIVLPGDLRVSAPISPAVADSSPYVLRRNGDDGWVITVDDEGATTTPVKVSHRPHFFSHRTSSGIPFGNIGTAHGPYLALSPTNRCSFLASADRCRFCGVAPDGQTHAGVPVDDIIEAVRIARGEHHVDMVYLSVGHLGTDDGGVRFLEPYVKAIKKHFDVFVAIDALPPATDGWIDRTYGMGADAVSYNLEIYDPERFARVCPGPARLIGQQRFLDALGYATTVFPSGAVTCHLIVGLEPPESTLAGIEALTALGVVPVLPVYRPFKGRDMRDDADIERFDLSLDDLAALYSALHDAVRRHKLSLNFVRDISIVTTPVDARFFSATGDTFWSNLHHRVMGSRLARRTSHRLSDLRRALRVREVGPS